MLLYTAMNMTRKITKRRTPVTLFIAVSAKSASILPPFGSAFSDLYRQVNRVVAAIALVIPEGFYSWADELVLGPNPLVFVPAKPAQKFSHQSAPFGSDAGYGQNCNSEKASERQNDRDGIRFAELALPEPIGQAK
ncbi:hypothetical protein KW803_01960 [Candidatus Saccharibacteria bacterium]|nr:hypothetical protein [Candidatus Saccharibacteria bacterium]